MLQASQQTSDPAPTYTRPSPEPDPAYTFENLKTGDLQALCAALGIPTPTPDVPFDVCARTAGYSSPRAVYEALQSTTEPRLMIAAAVIRGTVRKLPPDPRLTPQPAKPLGPARPDLFAGVPTYAPAPAAAVAGSVPRPPKTFVQPAPAVAAPRVKTADPEMQRVIIEVAPNPAKPGSNRAARYALYRVGMTLADARAAGVKQTDIERHVAQGLIKLTNADTTLESPPEAAPRPVPSGVEEPGVDGSNPDESVI